MKDARPMLTAIGDRLAMNGALRRGSGGWVFEGRLVDVHLTLSVRAVSGTPWVRIHLAGAPRVGPVYLEANRPWPRARRRPRVLTGDLRYDARVLVYGEPGVVAAAMTAPIRRATTAWVTTAGALIRSGPGGLKMSCPLPRQPLVAHAACIRQLVATWPLWAAPSHVPGRWADTATRDPDRRVRAINARTYLDAVDDAVPEDRGARLARFARAEGLPLHVREDAVVRLAGLPGGAAALVDVVVDGPPALREVAADAIQADPDGAVILCRAALMAADPVAHQLVKRLGAISDERAAAGLIGLLTRADEALQCAVFDALGRSAGLSLAPYLATEIEHRTGETVKAAARQALRRLRQRFGQVEDFRGGLSLVDGAGGDLAMASEE